MDETSPTERDGVSKLSRRGLLALGATLAGTSGIGMFSGSAAAHELMAFRDAFVGDDEDKEGLGSKGWLFFAKDTGTVYYHNGSDWVDLGLGGGDGALVDSDDDGLLEAPDHDGIDVGQVEAESVSAGDLTLTGLLQTDKPATPSLVGYLGSEGRLYGSDVFTLADGESTVLGPKFQDVRSSVILVKRISDTSSAVLVQAGTSLSILVSDGTWETTDTDSSNCVFIDDENSKSLTLKNRTGSTSDYTATVLHQN